MAGPRRSHAEAVARLIDAYRRDHIDDFLAAWAGAEEAYAVPQALRALHRSEHDGSQNFRMAFLERWIDDSSDLRESATDRTLLDALWKLLPAYEGGAVTLFRGDGMWNRRRRSYGMAWTDSFDVARRFAGEFQQFSIGGAVVLRTDAPPSAIICAPALLCDRLSEREFIVDRRRVGGITVVEKLPESSPSMRTR